MEVDPTTGAVSNKITVGGNTYNTIQEAIEDAAGNPLAVAYDDADKDVITLQGKSGTTTITNLGAGAIAAGSTAAINGGQLHGNVTSVATALGGGTTVDADGKLTGTEYSIGGGLSVDPATGAITGTPAFAVGGGNTKATIDDAFSAIGDEVDTLNTALNGVLTDALLFDGTAYNATRGGVATRITGVANGTVAAGSSDAVTGDQLHATNQAVAQNATDISNLDNRVTTVEGDVANLDNRVTTVEGDVANLNTTVNQHTTQINNLDGRVTQNTTAINNLDNRVTNVEGDITDLSQQITNVGGNVEQVRQQAATAQGTADEAMQLALGNDGRAFCSQGAGQNSVRCGANTKDDVTAANGIGIGTDAQALADGGIAVGTGAQATGTNTTAVGDNAKATGQYAVALGNNATATANNSVALGNGSVADQENTVSVGNATQQRRITNVAAGIDPTDAVNVSQLNAYRDEANYRFYQQDRRINSVGALSAAMAMAIPDYRVKGDFLVSVGVGHHVDAQAIGASFSGMINDRTSLRVGGAYAEGGESMVGAGMTFGW